MRVIAYILLVMLGWMVYPAGNPALAEEEKKFNMTYIYHGSLSSHADYVKATKGSLDVVSPNYFDLTKNGELKITQRFQASFVLAVHNQGIKVVPFLSNHWDIEAGINGLENREKLSQDIADAVKKYNLDGVNINIEGVNYEYRDKHTDFIRLLRKKIPSNKEVSVAVVANPRGFTTGWHGFYDYKKLHLYSDYLMMMTQDEHWEGSEPGPVASLSFTERSIQYALNQGVPKNKLVVGIPFYGRIWKLDGPAQDGQVIKGKGIPNHEVETLVRHFGGTFFYDEESENPKANFTIPKGHHYYAGNIKLTEGSYEVWYGNDRSFQKKLRTISRFDVKGTGSWSLGQEPASIWDFYTSFLNGQVFRDVGKNYWARESILQVYDKGWMRGTKTDLFSPNQYLTRAQGAVILIRALGLDERVPK
ncbi:MAG TPA: glycosyl hydrolase family 18 protein, partial [Chondromyces sp.]|nr:glycosyl hydrolase family 18 protein [Chondromyces sp.]